MPKKPKQVVGVQPLYSVCIDFGFGDKVEFQGDTILECLSKIEKRLFKGKTQIFVKKGDLKAEVYLYPPRMNRLLVNKTYRMLMDKRINLMLT